jgi:hypothetical protein
VIHDIDVAVAGAGEAGVVTPSPLREAARQRF